MTSERLRGWPKVTKSEQGTDASNVERLAVEMDGLLSEGVTVALGPNSTFCLLGVQAEICGYAVSLDALRSLYDCERTCQRACYI